MTGLVLTLLAMAIVLIPMGFGAYAHHLSACTPTARELALQAQVAALKTANHLGQEYFRAQQQMRGAASHSSYGPVINGYVVDARNV